MKTLSRSHNFLLAALLPLHAAAELPSSEQEFDVSVWSIVESRCEATRTRDEHVRCKIHAYKIRYNIGYTVHYTYNRTAHIELIGSFIGATAGLGLPFLPFLDFSSVRGAHTTSEGEHGIRDMTVDEMEPVASMYVIVKIDGTPIGEYKTDQDGFVSFRAPPDSVVELYGLYDKRSLSLNQTLYLDSDRGMHYGNSPTENAPAIE